MSGENRDGFSEVSSEERIVLCHGLFGFTNIEVPGYGKFQYFHKVVEDFQNLGFTVFVPGVLKSGGIPARARHLKQQLSGVSGPFHVIAHSMGGLDARYYVTHLGGHENVRTLTTLGAPHRGTFLAEWTLENSDFLLSLIEGLGVDITAYHHLTRPFVREKFNPDTPNHPDVRYFSYAGRVSPERLLPHHQFTWDLIHQEEGENDGIVSVQSAKWGEHVKTIEASHLELINWGDEFDGKSFFRGILKHLLMD